MRSTAATPSFSRKDVREEASFLLDLGFEYVGQRSGHPTFEHSDFGKIRLPLTPSESQHWRHNHRHRLAGLLGISKRELELRLGIRQEKRHGPKVRKQRNEEGRRARTFASKPPPSDLNSAPKLPTPTDRFKELPDLIARANHAVNTSVPGSLDYQRALTEAAQLRAEFMQLETEIAA